MGCNYYFIQFKKEPCSECSTEGQYTKLHLGKSSFGWAFLFQASEEVGNILDLENLLNENGIIIDEYNQTISKSDFLEKIARKQVKETKTPHDHVKVMPNSFLCGNGFSFTYTSFS